MRRHLLFPALALALLVCSCEEDPYALGYSAPPTVGAKAPNFSQNDTSGKAVTLNQFSGSVVLLDFWATWCGPCLSDIPNMKTIWQEYRNKGLVIVSVSLDDDLDSWRAYIRKNDLDWVHVADGKFWSNVVAKQYGVTAIPQKYLIGRDGKVIATGVVIDEATIAAALR